MNKSILNFIKTIFVVFAFCFVARAQPEPLEKTESPISVSNIIKGYAADSAGNHSVNTYFLVGKNSIVLIDTQWRISDAKRVLNHLRENFDQPVSAILITHPHRPFRRTARFHRGFSERRRICFGGNDSRHQN